MTRPLKLHKTRILFVGVAGPELVLPLLLGLGRKLLCLQLEHRPPELVELLLSQTLALLKRRIETDAAGRG
jgi:hypothetical protein